MLSNNKFRKCKFYIPVSIKIMVKLDCIKRQHSFYMLWIEIKSLLKLFAVYEGKYKILPRENYSQRMGI